MGDRYVKLLIYIVIGTVLFIMVYILLNKHFSFGVSDSSIVLTFIGIIATFVVIGNYSQVQDIKHEFEEKVKSMETTGQALSKTVSLLATSNTKGIDPHSYRILGVEHRSLVENWYVLITSIPIDKDALAVFVKQFRDEYCKKACNINLVDSEAAYPLITQYPLSGDDYLLVADHFVAMVSFDTPDVIWMYPFHDARYKELGDKGLNE